MKTLSIYLLTAAMGLSALSSCKKDSTGTPTPAASTKTDLLTAKNWKTTDIKVNGQSIFNSPLVDNCDKDDLTKFNTNKSATFDEGTLKCNTASPQSSNGSWDFTTGETKLKVTDPDGMVSEGTIGTLNNTTLILTDPNYGGLGFAAELTFTAQ